MKYNAHAVEDTVFNTFLTGFSRKGHLPGAVGFLNLKAYDLHSHKKIFKSAVTFCVNIFQYLCIGSWTKEKI